MKAAQNKTSRQVRVQKYLSGAGICSRRKAEQYILEGKVKINGVPLTQLGMKIDPEIDKIEFNGKIITKTPKLIYIALNKPQGYVTSCSHPGQKIILDLIDIPERIYPIGRLDRDSTGLLLLTNDGRMHQRLTHPSFDHEKEYEVTVLHPLSDKDLQKLTTGTMTLDGKKLRRATVTRLTSNSFRIILQEGRKRQIRRMIETLNNKVVALKRIRVSNIKLGNLPEGGWRYLTAREKQLLIKN